ncbi:MAG TPA: glycosyltransferase [Solirubrobacteraceae bacterium]|jgi:hypothetical protein|nr:glycosyltransferase [Solirubrobacteraceae bacterium]
MPTVVFHRNFQRFQGGHLKVFHYFQHVRASGSYDARISFSPDSLWDASNPWATLRESVIAPGEECYADVLFLAGMDWRWRESQRREDATVPTLNLIQGFRHTRADDPTRAFLARPAIRICIGAEVQDALQELGVRGPIFTVPIGIDLEGMPVARVGEERDIDCVVLAVKDRPLGGRIAERVRARGHRVTLVDRPVPREELLALMARARVAVHLPVVIEGAYIPALESMAVGAVVVCPDCIGNRSFCRDGETCIVPERSDRAIARATLAALAAPADELEPLLAGAREELSRRDLASERAGFLEILGRAHELWAAI